MNDKQPFSKSDYTKPSLGGGPQNQYFAGDNAVATLLGTTDAGGMRGAGLLAFMVAEIALKNKVVSLAQDYYNTNKRDYDYFVTHSNAMAATASQVMSPTTNPSYTLDYMSYAAAGLAIAAPVERKWFEARRRSHRYATGAHARMDFAFAAQRTFAMLAGWDAARRYTDIWTDEHNDRYFNRKLAIANVGIDVGNLATQGLATAVHSVSRAYDNIGDTVASIGNGFMARSGYNAGREGVRAAYNKELNNGS